MESLYKYFSCLTCKTGNTPSHAKCYSISSRSDASRMVDELEEYFHFIYKGSFDTFESLHASPEDVSTLKIMIMSVYSHKRSSSTWKVGIFGGVFLDLHLGEKIYRVTFKKNMDGSFDTYVKCNGLRDIPPPGRHCSYCRKDETNVVLKTCESCKSDQYCGRSCQGLDWVSRHSIYCSTF